MRTVSNRIEVKRVLLSVGEACEALSIGRTTLYGLMQNGRIAAVRIGKRGVRIAAGEVERFAREGGSDGA